MTSGLRKVENAHVAFWLLKDYSWCTLTKWLGIAMVVPTIGFAVHIAYASRRSADDLVHNAATCFWISANVVWMIGEFYLNDAMRPYARFLFWLGLATLAAWYAFAGLKWAARTLARSWL